MFDPSHQETRQLFNVMKLSDVNDILSFHAKGVENIFGPNLGGLWLKRPRSGAMA